MAGVMCLQFSMLEEDNIEHANWQLWFVYTYDELVDPLCNIGMNLMILLSKLMLNY